MRRLNSLLLQICAIGMATGTRKWEPAYKATNNAVGTIGDDLHYHSSNASLRRARINYKSIFYNRLRWSFGGATHL